MTRNKTYETWRLRCSKDAVSFRAWTEGASRLQT
jgi:hypothetical protein